MVRRGAVGDAGPAGDVAKGERADAMDLDRLLHGLEEHRRQIPRSVADVQHLATGPSRKSRPGLVAVPDAIASYDGTHARPAAPSIDAS